MSKVKKLGVFPADAADVLFMGDLKEVMFKVMDDHKSHLSVRATRKDMHSWWHPLSINDSMPKAVDLSGGQNARHRFIQQGISRYKAIDICDSPNWKYTLGLVDKNVNEVNLELAKRLSFVRDVEVYDLHPQGLLVYAIQNNVMPALETLDITQEQHTGGVRALIANGLKQKHMKKLWYLKIIGANDESFMGRLCEGIKYLPHLNYLNLYANDIGSQGMVLLCDAIRSGALSFLRDLKVDSNKVGDAGAEALANLIRDGFVPKMDQLGLGRNQIGDTGINALANCISEDRGPLFCEFEFNECSYSARQAFQDALSRRNRG